MHFISCTPPSSSPGLPTASLSPRPAPWGSSGWQTWTSSGRCEHPEPEAASRCRFERPARPCTPPGPPPRGGGRSQASSGLLSLSLSPGSPWSSNPRQPEKAGPACPQHELPVATGPLLTLHTRTGPHHCQRRSWGRPQNLPRRREAGRARQHGAAHGGGGTGTGHDASYSRLPFSNLSRCGSHWNFPQGKNFHQLPTHPTPKEYVFCPSAERDTKEPAGHHPTHSYVSCLESDSGSRVCHSRKFPRPACQKIALLSVPSTQY